jgi:hypothetical protein
MPSRVGETVSAGEQGAKLQDFVAYSPSGADVEASGSARGLKWNPFITGLNAIGRNRAPSVSADANRELRCESLPFSGLQLDSRADS